MRHKNDSFISFVIIFVIVLAWSSCSSIKYYTFFKTAQDDSSLLYISTPESLTYLRQTSYWSGEGVWGNLPYAINLPNMTLKRIINDRSAIYFFYDDNQVVLIKSVVTCSKEFQQNDGSNKFIKYKGHLIYYNDEDTYMSNRVSQADNDEELYKMSKEIEAVGIVNDSCPSEIMEFVPIPERRHCLIVKNGVRVIMFNILPKNFDFFVKTLDNIYIPHKNNTFIPNGLKDF